MNTRGHYPYFGEGTNRDWARAAYRGLSRLHADMCYLEHAFEYMGAGFALLEKERQSVCELLDAVQDAVWPHIKQTGKMYTCMVCREVIDPAEGDTCFCTRPVCDGETEKVQTTYEWSHPEYRKPRQRHKAKPTSKNTVR